MIREAETLVVSAFFNYYRFYYDMLNHKTEERRGIEGRETLFTGTLEKSEVLFLCLFLEGGRNERGKCNDNKRNESGRENAIF